LWLLFLAEEDEEEDSSMRGSWLLGPETSVKDRDYKGHIRETYSLDFGGLEELPEHVTLGGFVWLWVLWDKEHSGELK
jgi:hypothetical protein